MDPQSHDGEEADGDEDGVEVEEEAVHDAADEDPVVSAALRLGSAEDVVADVLQLPPQLPELRHGLRLLLRASRRVTHLHLHQAACGNGYLDVSTL